MDCLLGRLLHRLQRYTRRQADAAGDALAREYLRLYVIRPSPQGAAGAFYAVVRLP